MWWRLPQAAQKVATVVVESEAGGDQAAGSRQQDDNDVAWHWLNVVHQQTQRARETEWERARATEQSPAHTMSDGQLRLLVEWMEGGRSRREEEAEGAQCGL